MKNTKAYGAEIQDELRETAPEYEKWRRRLFIMNCVIATGVFLLEIGVNIILFCAGEGQSGYSVPSDEVPCCSFRTGVSCSAV